MKKKKKKALGFYIGRKNLLQLIDYNSYEIIVSMKWLILDYGRETQQESRFMTHTKWVSEEEKGNN